MSTREISPPLALPVAPPSAIRVAARPVELSLRRNFAWAVAGNVVFAVCQWGVIVALAKFGSSFTVGQFSLGLAIVTPILMFSNLDLRAVQATDANRQYRFSEYLRLRLVMTLTALVAIALIVGHGRYERGTALVILVLALAKGIETLSDIHYGLFQLNHRLDQTGRSMILRGFAALAAMGGGFYFTHNLVSACVCLALGWAAALVCFDFRHGRLFVESTEMTEETGWSRPMRLGQLLSAALPLGIVTTIASVNLHMPRYFIHSALGEHQLGIFSAMAYATVSLTLVGDSLGSSAIPKLSRLYMGGNLAAHRALVLRMLGVGSAIGLTAFALARACGGRLLTIFYTSDYASESGVFTILMAAAALHLAASMLTAGITSARSFLIQVPLYLLVAGATAWGCARWVPARGLEGAAIGVLCGAAVRLVLAGAVLGYLVMPDAA